MKSSATRLYNFSAGPAVLPVPVLEQAQRELISLPGVGMSVLEVSHRSKPFEDILARTEADIRALAGIPANYRVLFLQGGASLQFTMVPMNLLAAGTTADYLVTGVWATKAADEAKKIGDVHIAATTKAEQFTRIPRAEEIVLTPNASYVHMTSNNTIYGTEWKDLPRRGRCAAGERHLVGHVQPPDRRREACADLFRRAEEPRAGRGHAGHHPRGSAGEVRGVAARHAQLCGACGAQVALQHAAGLCDLPDGPRREVDSRPGRARSGGRDQPAQRRPRCTRRSTVPVFIAAPRRRTAAR